MSKSVYSDPYEGLANAIVLQAVKDYRVALKKLRKNPRNKAAADEKKSCEEFFRSQWFGILTSVDPEYLINRLNEEVNA